MRVCHFSTVHANNDIRIFHKECVSLANAGYTVYCIANGKDKEEYGVHILGMHHQGTNRFIRMVVSTRKVFKKAIQLDCDVYHFHDPELLLWGVRLKKKGKIVIFDSHEDVPSQILDKYWIPIFLRKIIATIYKSIESYAVKRLDAVVAATPFIAKKFEGRAPIVITINNYPKLDDIKPGTIPFENRESIACYAGGINENRGEEIMKQAINGTDGKLILAGEYDSSKKELASDNVQYLGRIDREAVNELYGNSVVGLCLLKPTANYINSQPIKIYEYMAAGLPFICSDFPLWQKLVEKTQAGICVKYDDIDTIRKTIISLFSDRDNAYQMGQRGFHAVKNNYTWQKEAEKLISLYQLLTSKR